MGFWFPVNIDENLQFTDICIITMLLICTVESKEWANNLGHTHIKVFKLLVLIVTSKTIIEMAITSSSYVRLQDFDLKTVSSLIFCDSASQWGIGDLQIAPIEYPRAGFVLQHEGGYWIGELWKSLSQSVVFQIAANLDNYKLRIFLQRVNSSQLRST